MSNNTADHTHSAISLNGVARSALNRLPGRVVVGHESVGIEIPTTATTTTTTTTSSISICGIDNLSHEVETFDNSLANCDGCADIFGAFGVARRSCFNCRWRLNSSAAGLPVVPEGVIVGNPASREYS